VDLGHDTIALRQDAAHEQRNWVRLTSDCNNHCVFCLDTLVHDGSMRSALEVKIQIVEGRKRGATRLILSGGEPTMHPQFLEFVKLGRRSGYRRVQTVTNGRMFAYPEFLQRAADCGLDEITFSVHGHTAKLHDALVGAPGAFEEEVTGLKAALASGRFIVNVDVVINKMNVAVLPEMLETFIEWGVREFDLLQVIPFGNAWGKAKHSLFYDLEGHEQVLARAFEISRRPGIQIWLNRFPPAHAEGFEDLIQDPHKLEDEVRGRREEFDRYLSLGEKLDCREPARCKHCYLEPLCDGLDAAIADRALPEVDVLRLVEPGSGATTLPRARIVHVVASDAKHAMELAELAPDAELWLELDTYAELPAPELDGRAVARVFVRDAAEIERVRAWPGDFEIVVALRRETAPLLAALAPLGSRLLVQQPSYERLTDQRREDVDVRSVCEQLPASVRTLNLPACLGGRDPKRNAPGLDGAMLGGDGRVDMTRYTQRFVAARFMTKSRRCRQCVHDASCEGVHLNFVRAHGYGVLEPVSGS
jgi:MoaA/NifB/PqqE/SkfB family radical SAM enzyme